MEGNSLNLFLSCNIFNLAGNAGKEHASAINDGAKHNYGINFFTKEKIYSSKYFLQRKA